MAEGRGLWSRCESALRLFERAMPELDVAPQILFAIALNESARHGRPWPWTLNDSGRPLFFPSRESAWRAAERIRAVRPDGLDIGLMQIHWRTHASMLGSTWQALDPEHNIRVAAALYRDGYRRTGDIYAAAGRYHSATPEYARPYVQRFIEHYRMARSLGGRVRHESGLIPTLRISTTPAAPN